MEKVKVLLEENLTEKTVRVVVSNRRKSGDLKKLVFRPFLEKNRLMFQQEEYRDKQVFHTNMDKASALEQICSFLEKEYKQMDLQCEDYSFSVLVNKKGKSTIKK